MESFGWKYLNVLQTLSKVPIKCPVTEVLYDSLSPSTTFEVLPCLVILKLSGIQQFSYKHRSTWRTCSCQECSMNTDFSLSIALLYSVLSHILSQHNKFTNYFLVRKIAASTTYILYPICLELKAGYVLCTSGM